MIINPYIIGTSGPVVTENTITISAGTVSSDLTNFPVMVRLSSMPSGFWTNVKSSGGDVRVKTTGGTVIPHDLARFDYDAQDGVLFFKASSVPTGSSSSWKITCGEPSLNRLDYTDTNGRNAVWSDYAGVFLLGETADNRCGGNTISVEGDPDFFVSTSTQTSLPGVQGVCSDGTYYYIFDTTAIYKYDLSWNLVASNTNALADCNISTANHIGDGDVHGGLLYAPVERYISTSTFSVQHICIFNASDLAFVSKTDVSAQGHECSSIAYCTADDLLYITSYASDDKFYKYNSSTQAYIGDVTLTWPTGAPSEMNLQGITWWRDAFWINSHAFDEIFRVTQTGVAAGSGLFGIAAFEQEGIGNIGDYLLQMEQTSGATGTVRKWKPRDETLCAGGGASIASDCNLPATGLTSATTWTMGVTAAVSSTGSNRNIASYWNSAGSATARATLAYRNSSNELALWDNSNSWLSASPVFNPTLNTAYRLHGVYSGTTSRKFYINGVLKNTQTSISAPPASLNTLRLCNNGTGEPFRGLIGYAYLRASALSDAWIAAEYSNVNAPGSFYTIT